MELDWSLPKLKQSPAYISFSPEPIELSQNFLNPFLGYTNCPIIGRYNRGQYRIGETLFQLEFKCEYDENTNRYMCGNKQIRIPQYMHHNLRNIPQVIINNKAAGIKNSPEVLPQKYPVRKQVSVYWIVSFGEIGRDFLNYLNHMYILACTLFLEERFQRMLHYLPIYAFLPQNSGLMKIEVERGLNFNNYRGQYMSFHLNKGAPAFSPNNMRLGVQGGKNVTSNQPSKKKYKLKQTSQEAQLARMQQVIIEKQAQIAGKIIKNQDFTKKEIIKKQEQQFVLNWNQIESNSESYKNEKKYQPKTQENKKQVNKHQGFIHFYTSVLLEKDYRVYYHWHIQDKLKEELIKDVWKHSASLQEFVEKYSSFLGKDPILQQIKGLLFCN